MQNNTKTTLKIYLKATLKYKWSLFLIILGITAASIFNVLIPWYFKKFFDVITTQGEGVGEIVGQLFSILAIIAVLEGIMWIFWRIATFTASYFQPKVMADLNNSSFEYLHKHSFNFFNNTFVGSLVKKVKWFSRSFETITDKIFWSLLPLMVNIILIVYILWQRSFWLGFAILGWTAIFLGINWVFTRYKLKYDIEKATQETKITGVLADTITNQNNIKLFNGYKREVNNFRDITETLRKLTKFTWNLSDYFEALQGFLMAAFEVGSIYLAIHFWQQGILTIGDFVLLQSYLFNIFHRVWDFGRIIRQIYEALADAAEMTEILETPHEIQDAMTATELKVNRGEIDFQNVVFCYHQTRKVLDNFNLKIQSRERVALIGSSGAGKTTIVKLILREQELTDGAIFIDEQNIAKVTQESLRGNISMVPQDPILFHRTLMENIRYSKPEASDEEVIRASKLARCHDFIQELPEKYNSYVGERGIKLSGGERQRVAIARAILKNSPILILDEATSSLDSSSEKLIQEAIEELMKDKTVIVIAHRLSTIRQMDRIIVVDEGKIVEMGKHNELLSQSDGKYKKLWDIQAGSFSS